MHQVRAHRDSRNAAQRPAGETHQQRYAQHQSAYENEQPPQMNQYGSNANLLKQSSYEQRRSSKAGDYFMTPKRDFETAGER